MPTSTALDIDGRSAGAPLPSASWERLASAAIARFSGAALAVVGWPRLVEVELWSHIRIGFPYVVRRNDSLASCRKRGCTRRECETSKNPTSHSRVGDRREDSHASATFRAGKRVNLEDSLKEFGPGNTTLQNRFSPSP